MSLKRRIPQHHPLVILLSVWVGMLFWVGVYWVAGTVAFVLDARLETYAFAPGWTAPIGVIMSLIGATFIFWSTYVLVVSGGGSPMSFIAPPKRLVTWGIYSRLRHPMSLGFIILTFGLGLVMDSASFVFILAPALLVIIATNAFLEEASLRRTHGEHFEHYRRWTPGFRPRLRRA